jgi:hypothetical protein
MMSDLSIHVLVTQFAGDLEAYEQDYLRFNKDAMYWSEIELSCNNTCP